MVVFDDQQGGRYEHHRAAQGASMEGHSEGHVASSVPFSCKSELIKNHPSDPTGLQRVCHTEAKNRMLTTLFRAVYRRRGSLWLGAVVVR